MEKEELRRAVGEYIDKYYVPGNDDIRLDKEMESIFDRISKFRKRRADSSKQVAETPIEMAEFEIVEDEAPAFDVESMQKSKMSRPVSSAMVTQRNIDDLTSASQTLSR